MKNDTSTNIIDLDTILNPTIEDEVKELPDIYYVLAWNFKKEILANNQDLINKGVEFYFPVNPKVSA